MSQKKKRIDPNQTSFDFESSIQAYKTLKDKLLNNYPPASSIESYAEASMEIASAVKRAIRACGMSREQMVDAINNYFGWSGINKDRHLSIHIFNHYLSKPAEYPMPTVYIFAIQHITGSLNITGTLAEAEGGRVITWEEIRELTIGKLDNAILEMQRLKREFRGLKR